MAFERLARRALASALAALLVAPLPVGAADEAPEDGSAVAPAGETADAPPVRLFQERRRRPGRAPRVFEREPLPPLERWEPAGPFVPVPDRWRIVESIGVNERWWDPYNQNTLKADRPIFGRNWFLNLGLISDSVLEGRRLPVPVGNQATQDPGSLDVFGTGDQFVMNENLILLVSLLQGNTVFRPPDHEFRLSVVPNVNFVKVGERGIVNVDPDDGLTRLDWHVGIQELFYDRHLRNKSHFYDFDSLRGGIQPFISDFRGFLFQDMQPGLRLFGNFRENRAQYNLAYFRRLEKDTNSGLNKLFDFRRDDLFFANLYTQDFLHLGFQTEAIVAYNRNTEGGEKPHFNENGFIERPASIGEERPHDYDVVYAGLGGDGHIRRLNLTANGYLALGHDERNPIAQRSQTIVAWFLAAEGSVDFDWYRLKAYGMHTSGDGDPFDGTAHGFDAIFENPNFAGAATSYWHRQPMPLVGGGGVALTGRNGLIPSLRSSKEEGQSNFVNPGLWLAGIGADFDVLPELRILTNAYGLAFAETAVLEAVRQQANVANPIGLDVSVGFVYRPLFIENVVFNFSVAGLIPGAGLRDLYEDRYDVFYSTFLNAIVTY